MKFSELVESFQNGALDDELTAALEEVASEVALTGKTGSVSLKLALGEKAGGVIVSASTSSSMPKTARERFLYLSDDGLSVRDPRQPELFEQSGDRS